MSEFDDVSRQIDDLHMEAEELSDLARAATSSESRRQLLEDAKRKLRQAARLRMQANL